MVDNVYMMAFGYSLALVSAGSALHALWNVLVKRSGTSDVAFVWVYSAITAPLWLFQTQRELLEAGTNPRVIFSLHSQHRVQSAYWHSYGVAQAALEKLIATLHAEKHAYPAIGFATVDPGWVDTPLSRAVYPAGQAHWRAAEAAVPLYLDALRGNPEPLEQHHA